MMHAGYPGQYDTRATVDCKYHLEGRCSLGDACPFRHIAEKFNTAARPKSTFQPHSQPHVCHFFLNGKCTKGDSCAFQHPTLPPAAAPRPAAPPQEEMNIDFEEDESPRQPEQSRPVKPAAPKQAPPVQARLGSKVQQAQTLPRRGEERAQQPLLNRLGPQQGASESQQPGQRRQSQSTFAEQDDTEKSKGSVFERLSMSRPGTALDRLSAPGQANRPVATTRPMNARELLVQSITAKARVGRKEAELVRPGAAARGPGSSQAARQGSSELQPASIAGRRILAVSRGAKGSPAPVHAPKYASPATSEGTGIRKSALERIARPQQNGTASTSSASTLVTTPATAGKPRRASAVPFTSTRLRPNASSSHTPSQTPAHAPQASGAATPSITPAAGSVSAATPTSEQSTGGTDKRGRQKITWQPPTATQQEEAAQESRANVSKRKASDAASPSLDIASAAANEEVSPSKRIKAQDSTDKQAVSVAEPVAQAPAQQEPAVEPVTAAAAPADEHQADVADDLEPLDDTGMDGEDVGLEDLGEDDMGEDGDADDDVVYEDDFDDEATMRELEALG